MTAISSYNLQILQAPTLRSVPGDVEDQDAQPQKRSEQVFGKDSAQFSSAARDLAAQEDPTVTSAGPKEEKELSQDEKEKVTELKARDAEVRAHEQAHLSALGGEGGSANYEYTTGPDGRRYATGGEVPVSIGESAGGPRDTIQKAQRIARAAVAPARPSSADQAARAKAQQVEAKARQELRKQQESGEDESSPEAASANSTASSASGLIDSATIKPNSDSDSDEKKEKEQEGLETDSHDHVHKAGEECAICAQSAA